MNCLAIGDILIPSRSFDEALSESPLFTHYKSINWNITNDRAAIRDVVREIETKGSRAFELPASILEAASDIEVLFVHLCPVPSELIDRAVKLRYIMTARGGLENIDVDMAKKRNVTIVNTPSHNAIAVAEYAIGLMICEMRNIVRSDACLRNNFWQEQYDNSGAIPELIDSSVGLIGFGTIGKLVAKRLRSFGSIIKVFDPYVDSNTIEAHGCKKVELVELLQTCNIVSLHSRLPVGSPPIIGKNELQRMRKDAYLINTARAALVDMDALYEALRSKLILGAAIDVFPVEPLPVNYNLLQCENTTLTNHRGGDTLNAYIKTPRIMLKQLEEYVV